MIDVPVSWYRGRQGPGLAISKTGERLPGRVKDLDLVVVQGGSYAILWTHGTHADQVNSSLQTFLA